MKLEALTLLNESSVAATPLYSEILSVDFELSFFYLLSCAISVLDVVCKHSRNAIKKKKPCHVTNNCIKKWTEYLLDIWFVYIQFGLYTGHNQLRIFDLQVKLQNSSQMQYSSQSQSQECRSPSISENCPPNLNSKYKTQSTQFPLKTL